MSEPVSVHIENHVAEVRLNRPEKMNALSWAMFEALTEVGQSLARDREVRAVVLTGAGDHFCAGMDLENFANVSPEDDFFRPGRGGEWPNYYQSPARVWREVPAPVICALHGVAYGGGLQIALGADVRIAHPTTRLSVMEIKWGLIPDMSASQTLRHLVRVDVAKELTFTGRVVEGSEALELGLVTRLADDPLAEARDLAASIAARNPDAIALAKRLFDTTRDGDETAGLETEERLQKRLLGSANQMEALMAGLERRPGAFGPRGFATFDDIDN
ncbi:crotonase/enoyl-CoA hydratase family protein [Mangrovimicrobium sediminis]|uniref:Crotonase/enoyl-CoA hydratase family protein n=1 Tax=Mangrovimicrobium sediminis TaxID=2562682 RepID=A0A4Z0M934_9GAMM|nr:crotonase/enoyl-CoA hydratase family protein [Haliea sp. SAOS-164]TGD76041.1 crotonase/enoyl-CoA hydratase family protein [Haliea sp. SAOS-164]